MSGISEGPGLGGDGHILAYQLDRARDAARRRAAAIGQQAGVKMVLRGDLATPVTETLVDVPLDAAIQGTRSS